MADGQILSKVELLTNQGNLYIQYAGDLRKNIGDLRNAIELLKSGIGGKTNPALDASFAEVEAEVLDYVPKLENVGTALVDAANRHLNEDDSLAGEVSIELV